MKKNAGPGEGGIQREIFTSCESANTKQGAKVPRVATKRLHTNP